MRGAAARGADGWRAVSDGWTTAMWKTAGRSIGPRRSFFDLLSRRLSKIGDSPQKKKSKEKKKKNNPVCA